MASIEPFRACIRSARRLVAIRMTVERDLPFDGFYIPRYRKSHSAVEASGVGSGRVHFSVKLASVELDRIPFFNPQDRKSTRLNSSHTVISYAVFCLKKK